MKCRNRRVAHPLFVQFKELLGGFGRVERQPQTGDAELGDHLLQDLLQRQTSHGAVAPRRHHRILQDGASQRHKLDAGQGTMI